MSNSSRKYGAVIFDLFGTLVPAPAAEGYQSTVDDMAKLLSAPVNEFREAYGLRSTQRMTGVDTSIEETIVEACNSIGVTPSAVALAAIRESLVSGLASLLEPRPDALQTLIGLRDMGFQIGLITDCSPEAAEYWEKTPFAPLIPAPIFSCVEGVQKPDPAIFLAACRVLGVTPEACIYVGDGGSQELSGATCVGMHAIQLRDPYDVETNAHRPGLEKWDGQAISSLSQIHECL